MRRVRECGKLPFKSSSSRTKRVTRLWRQETPTHEAVHGSEEEFQEARTVLFGSAVDLRRRRGWVSGLVTAAA